MEVPDKIYTSPNIENRTWLIGKADTTSVEYIRKEALLEWVKEMKRICQGAEPIEKAYQTMIDKIESL